MVTRRTLLGSSLAAACLAPSALAQVRVELVPEVADALGDLLETGLYLPFLKTCQRAVAQATTEGRRNYALQNLALACSVTGQEDAAFAALHASHGAVAPAPLPTLDGAKAEPALQAIVRAARDRRVLILDEAHHASQCRAFAEAVAERLASEGFHCIAAEALSVERAGPVTTAYGPYVCDPVFAELFRTARRAGMTVARYEATRAQEQAAQEAGRAYSRDLGQAANLARRLAGLGDGKLFVYCGPGHINRAHARDYVPMAEHLKALTGVDPLCVTQAAGVADPDVLRRDLPYAVWARFKNAAPIVLRDRAGQPLAPGVPPGAVDMAVFHPRLPDSRGRPGWLVHAPRRRRTRFSLPAGLGGALVQAVPSQESAATNAVPADQYLVTGSASEATFFLRPGRYEVRAETDQGRRELGPLAVA